MFTARELRQSPRSIGERGVSAATAAAIAKGPTSLLATALTPVQFPFWLVRQLLSAVDPPSPCLLFAVSLIDVSLSHPPPSNVYPSCEWIRSMGSEFIQTNAPSVFTQFYHRCLNNISELLLSNMAESASPIGIANVSFVYRRASRIVC